MHRDSKRSRIEEGASPRRRRVLGSLLALMVSPLLMAAWGSSKTASTTTTDVSIPSGWKTYTYGKMAIAVPSSWVVKHDTDCPNAAPAGALLLGSSTAPGSCLPTQIPSSVVTVERLSGETSATAVPVGQKPVSINGIPVYLGFGSITRVQWTVPTLNVQITGTGPDSNQVMHTLHEA